MSGTQPRRLLLLVPALLLACTNGGTSGDTDVLETDTDTSTGSTSSDPGVEASSSSSTGSDPTVDESSSTTGGDEPSETGELSTTGDTTGSVSLDGLCIGLDRNGSFSEVLSRDGAQLEPTCSETPAPCGGDLLGTWTYAQSCGEENLPALWTTICPAATETVLDATVTGTLTFEDDGSYARAQTTTVLSMLAIDAPRCLELSCAEFEALLASEQGVTATCGDAQSGCDCEVETVVEATDEGTYEAERDGVTLTFGGEETGMLACVTGDRLDLWTEQYAFALTDEACADARDCEDALGDAHALYICEFDDRD